MLTAQSRTDRLRLTNPKVTISELTAMPARIAVLRSDQDSSLSPSDRERLESLEKKLAKLLDEVASLKKHDK